MPLVAAAVRPHSITAFAAERPSLDIQGDRCARANARSSAWPWPSRLQTVLAAQTPRPTALDTTVVVSFGSGGHFAGQVGVEGALTLVPKHRASPVLGITIGGVNSLPYTQECVVVEYGEASGSGCGPRFPTVTYVGLLGGLEQVRAAGGVRLLAGPAVFNGRRRTALRG